MGQVDLVAGPLPFTVLLLSMQRHAAQSQLELLGWLLSPVVFCILFIVLRILAV